MTEHVHHETLDATSAERMREHRERVQREEVEWRTSRFHHRMHGNWTPEDCPRCVILAEEIEMGMS